MLRGSSVIHYDRVSGKVKGRDKKKDRSKPKEMKKHTQGGREKSAQKYITHPEREKQKSNKERESGEVGDLAIGVTPGRGFLSSISRSHSTKSEPSIYTAL